ncbi:MAG: hypothetical protein H2174_05345 [Vampirovibrio sp.]|nr:hypothetical protein [Vampirovibrio sp.]
MTTFNNTTTPAFKLNASNTATAQPKHPLKVANNVPRKTTEDTFVKAKEPKLAVASAAVTTKQGNQWLLPVAGSMAGVLLAIGTFFVGKKQAEKETLKIISDTTGKTGDTAEKLAEALKKEINKAPQIIETLSSGTTKILQGLLTDPADKAKTGDALIAAVQAHVEKMKQELQTQTNKLSTETENLKKQLASALKVSGLATDVDLIDKSYTELLTLAGEKIKELQRQKNPPVRRDAELAVENLYKKLIPTGKATTATEQLEAIANHQDKAPQLQTQLKQALLSAGVLIDELNDKSFEELLELTKVKIKPPHNGGGTSDELVVQQLQALTDVINDRYSSENYRVIGGRDLVDPLEQLKLLQQFATEDADKLEKNRIENLKLTGKLYDVYRKNIETELPTVANLAIISDDVIKNKLDNFGKEYSNCLNSGHFTIELNGLVQKVKKYACGGTKHIYKVRLTPDGPEYALALASNRYYHLFRESEALQGWRDVGVASHDFSHIVPVKVGNSDVFGTLMPLMNPTKHFSSKDPANNTIEGTEAIKTAEDFYTFVESLVNQTIELKLKGIIILGLDGDATNLKKNSKGELEHMVFDILHPPSKNNEKYKNISFAEEEIVSLVELVYRNFREVNQPGHYIKKLYEGRTTNGYGEPIQYSNEIIALTKKINQQWEKASAELATQLNKPSTEKTNAVGQQIVALLDASKEEPPTGLKKLLVEDIVNSNHTEGETPFEMGDIKKVLSSFEVRSDEKEKTFAVRTYLIQHLLNPENYQELKPQERQLLTEYFEALVKHPGVEVSAELKPGVLQIPKTFEADNKFLQTAFEDVGENPKLDALFEHPLLDGFATPENKALILPHLQEALSQLHANPAQFNPTDQMTAPKQIVKRALELATKESTLTDFGVKTNFVSDTTWLEAGIATKKQAIGAVINNLNDNLGWGGRKTNTAKLYHESPRDSELALFKILDSIADVAGLDKSPSSNNSLLTPKGFQDGIEFPLIQHFAELHFHEVIEEHRNTKKLRPRTITSSGLLGIMKEATEALAQNDPKKQKLQQAIANLRKLNEHIESIKTSVQLTS